MLDETVGCEPAIRLKHREALEHWATAPLDPVEREEFEREQWGLSREAIQASEDADRLFPETT